MSYSNWEITSQYLGLGLRELQKQWFVQHGYKPIVAESFSDHSSHREERKQRSIPSPKTAQRPLSKPSKQNHNTRPHAQQARDPRHHHQKKRWRLHSSHKRKHYEAARLREESLLAIIPFDEAQSHNGLLDTYVRQPQQAIRLIKKHPHAKSSS